MKSENIAIGFGILANIIVLHNLFFEINSNILAVVYLLVLVASFLAGGALSVKALLQKESRKLGIIGGLLILLAIILLFYKISQNF